MLLLPKTEIQQSFVRYKITHETTYQYSAPVFLEPHHFYFFPASRAHIRLIDFQINVSPDPAGLSARLDAEDNIYHQSWFLETQSMLKINTLTVVDVAPFNPFDLLKEEGMDDHPILSLYKDHVPLGQNLSNWILEKLKGENGDVLSCLSTCCRVVQNEWDHEVRYEENLMQPDECFSTKTGSCRDLSWMLIAAFRSLEIPARFISGYSHNPELKEGHELHAWLEVWVPGAGWVAGDPSAGILINEQYIPVTSSYDPVLTLPVQGIYRGSADSQMITEVKIDLIEGFE